jgi:signal transduction histidine kinase
LADERSIFDALPEAVVVVGEDGRVSFINDRAEALLGLTGDAVGRGLEDVLELRDDTGARCVLPLRRPVVGDRLAERVLQVTSVGRPRAVAVAGRWWDGELVLTARSAGRREQLDAVHGDVVATVSHEIRSPLTSVKGFTRTLLSKWERFSDEQKRAMLETIDADADRVTRLLKELLDVSRIDAGRVQLRRLRVDVLALADSVVEKARHHEAAAGRSIRVIAADEVPALLADVDKLEQVLLNLVENALGYSDGPVEVHISIDDADQLYVVVADEGPGIPEDQHRLVFQKFGRGRDVRRAGTGLGLYITRGLVRAHGGRIWIEPGVTVGTRVHVTIPVDPIG